MNAKDSGKLAKMLDDAGVTHSLEGRNSQSFKRPPKSNSILHTVENQTSIKYKNKFDNEDSI